MTSSNLSGTTIGPYELYEVIGRGGMSTVYRAHQPSMNRDVAIKVISSELAADEEFMARFVREAQIVAHLQHPHILPVYDFGESDDRAYLVMRLVQGGSLAEAIKEGPLPPERVTTLVRQITSALDYAHLRGIIHRDLKPTNILLDEDDNAYLTDFGIAKSLAEGTGTGLTITGQVMGTPTYMAPEQWRSEPVDGRTDIYALGVIIYQMLLGQAPFAADTPHGMMYQHLDMEPPPPHTLRPELPLSVDPVLRTALAKDREDRYASAGDLADALEEALSHPPRMPEQTDFDARDAALETLRTQAQYYDRRASDAAETQEGAAEQETVPPVWDLPPVHQTPAEPLPHPASPPGTPPYNAVPSGPSYAEPLPPEGLAQVLQQRWVWFGLAAVAGIALIVFVVLIGSWLSGDGDSGTRSEPTVFVTETSVPTPTLANPPRAMVVAPQSGTQVELGNNAVIEYQATDVQGITRVELQRFGVVLASEAFNGQTRVQGSFRYRMDSTGTHALEVVPWRGDARGIPSEVTIYGR